MKHTTEIYKVIKRHREKSTEINTLTLKTRSLRSKRPSAPHAKEVNSDWSDQLRGSQWELWILHRGFEGTDILNGIPGRLKCIEWEKQGLDTTFSKCFFYLFTLFDCGMTALKVISCFVQFAVIDNSVCVIARAGLVCKQLHVYFKPRATLTHAVHPKPKQLLWLL